MDVDMDGFSDTSDAEVDGESSTTRNQQNAYFPFPSEVFFLLYSYAHNTSRPKVITIQSHLKLWLIIENLSTKNCFPR